MSTGGRIAGLLAGSSLPLNIAKREFINATDYVKKDMLPKIERVARNLFESACRSCQDSIRQGLATPKSTSDLANNADVVRAGYDEAKTNFGYRVENGDFDHLLPAEYDQNAARAALISAARGVFREVARNSMTDQETAQEVRNSDKSTGRTLDAGAIFDKFAARLPSGTPAQVVYKLIHDKAKSTNKEVSEKYGVEFSTLYMGPPLSSRAKSQEERGVLTELNHARRLR